MRPSDEEIIRYQILMLADADKRSCLAKERWKDPEYRINQLASMRDPVRRANQSRIMKEKWKEPGFRAMMIEAMNKRGSK